jgi:hypothetical protein
MLAAVELSDDVQRVAASAERFAAAGEQVEAVLAAEPAAGERTYLVAFSSGDDRSWLALDAAGSAITSRERVHDAVSITAICEVAEDAIRSDPSLDAAPRLASPHYLDTLGTAAESELGGAIQGALGAVEELARDVEANYKLQLR